MINLISKNDVKVISSVLEKGNDVLIRKWKDKIMILEQCPKIVKEINNDRCTERRCITAKEL